MQAFGSDRVRPGDGQQIILSSRLSKGWTTGNERIPGTAVLWDERYFEVVGIEQVPQGFRYVLEPWRDHHTMRLTDRYDAESEAQRVDEHRNTLKRETSRKSANLF